MKYKVCDYYGNVFQEPNLEYIILSKTYISFNDECKQICNLTDVTFFTNFHINY